MHCPNPQCDYEGYQQSGLCPKCGQKLLPSAKMYQSLVKPKSWMVRLVEILLNILFRSLETVLFFVAFYVLLYAFILLYNMICEEIEQWQQVNFYGTAMFYVKVAALILIAFFNFKYRWRRK